MQNMFDLRGPVSEKQYTKLWNQLSILNLLFCVFEQLKQATSCNY